MRYTQKDVRAALGLSRDMLRLYERRGIISPEVNPENGYRYYDDWQVNLLWECKRFQAMGFSLAEIREMVASDDLGALLGRIARGREGLAEKIERERVVLDGYDRLLAQLRRLPGCLGAFEEQDLAETVYVAERAGHDLIAGAGERPEVAFMTENHGLTRPFFVFPGGGCRDAGEGHDAGKGLSDAADHDDERGRRGGAGRYYWGKAMDADVYERFGGPAGTGALGRVPAGRALVTWADAGERWGFGRHLFDGLLAEASRRGLEPAGDLCGYLLVRSTGEDGYHRYVKAILPVKETAQASPTPPRGARC